MSELSNKLGSLNLTVPEELKEFNKALTACLKPSGPKTLERFKRNLEIIQKGVARVKELEEKL